MTAPTKLLLRLPEPILAALDARCASSPSLSAPSSSLTRQEAIRLALCEWLGLDPALASLPRTGRPARKADDAPLRKGV